MRRVVRMLGQDYIARLNRREWEAQRFTGINERPAEYAFALECMSEVAPRTVLDIGTGLTPWPALLRACGFVVTALDQVEDYWHRRIVNRHFHVVGDDVLAPSTKQRFDFITCISVLEHIPDHALAVCNMLGMLEPGGHLMLSFPYSHGRYVEDVYGLPGVGYGSDGRYVCQVFSKAEVEGWLAESGARLVRRELWAVFTGDLWAFGERFPAPKRAAEDEPHQLATLLIQGPEG